MDEQYYVYWETMSILQPYCQIMKTAFFMKKTVNNLSYFSRGKQDI